MFGVVGSIAGPLALIKNALARLTKGESTEIPCLERVDEIGEMAKAADSFRALAEQTKHEHWVAETLAGLANQITSGEMSTVPGTMISYFCKKLKIPVGAVYVPDEDGVMFVRAASYGMAERSEVASSFRIGDGLIGQCAQEKNTGATESGS